MLAVPPKDTVGQQLIDVVHLEKSHKLQNLGGGFAPAIFCIGV